jgi:SPP1 gp7 family putative phage head morphogenesis protein
MPEMEIKFEPLPMDEAIEFWREKIPLTPDEFYAMAAEARSKAFTISGISSLDILFDIHKALLKALEKDTTFEEFRKEVNAIFEKKGWTGLSPYRLDNVFRTNIQTAYQVGRYRQMTDPDIINRRPYWMYDAVNDSRTRETHLALDQVVFPADHPFWDTWYPPNGYRCRCGVQSLSEREVKKQGLKVSTEIPKMVAAPGQLGRPLLPDPGFTNNPAKAFWEPDLSKYPRELKDAYLDRSAKGVDMM